MFTLPFLIAYISCFSSIERSLLYGCKLFAIWRLLYFISFPFFPCFFIRYSNAASLIFFLRMLLNFFYFLQWKLQFYFFYVQFAHGHPISLIATLGLHLGFSAKLRIWQVSACKMEPRSGIISWLGPPTPPPPPTPS